MFVVLEERLLSRVVSGYYGQCVEHLEVTATIGLHRGLCHFAALFSKSCLPNEKVLHYANITSSKLALMALMKVIRSSRLKEKYSRAASKAVNELKVEAVRKST